jgi:histidinol-phosphate aminotransferase
MTRKYSTLSLEESNSNREQIELKQAFCKFRGCDITPSNVCLSSGLDEVIDLLVRSLCRPGRDRIAICPPVYHMYQTSALINDIATVAIPLQAQHKFQLQLSKLQRTLSSDPAIRLCFICSPGNPTGYAIPVEDITAILENTAWRGILVVDEAYIDFAPEKSSCLYLLKRHPRLVVLQTLSKAFGLAGIRVAFAVACSHLCQILNNVRKPYAISGPSIACAAAALTPASLLTLESQLLSLRSQRSHLAQELEHTRGVAAIRGGIDANFVLFEVYDPHSPSGGPCNTVARWLCESLKESCSIFVRYKGDEPGCKGCIRVTVSTEADNQRLLGEIRRLLHQLHGPRGS